MKVFQFTRYLGYVVIWSLSPLAMVACKPAVELRSETWYSAPTWSFDDSQVAYVKSDVEFERHQPRFSLFIGEDTIIDTPINHTMRLCINDRSGLNEQCLADIPVTGEMQKDGVIVAIEWLENGIFYGIRTPSQDQMVAWRISLDRAESVLVSPGGLPKDIEPRRMSGDSIELYTGAGGYGFFSNQAIYLFNHLNRTTSIYIADASAYPPPVVPPYSVTGR